MLLLAGDIGGTKTSLAIISSEAGPREPLAETRFPSANYASLEALVRDFLDRVEYRPKRAAFGVAGPVVEGRSTITNLPWKIDERRLGEALGLSPVRLVNDLFAIAYAVPWLEEGDLHTLNRGQVDERGTLAVIAPGTGLGEAFLTWDGSRYHAHASEGGHADFGPIGELEIEMLRFLQDRFDHVSYERICSGIGLPNIYAYLKESGYAREPAWLAERLAAADDPTPVIVQAALDDPAASPLCTKTLEMFVSILGREAGNLALKVLSTGGVYLGGGIPPRILGALKHERFLQNFRRKGRMFEILSKMPVHVIVHRKAALLGAACYGLDL